MVTFCLGVQFTKTCGNRNFALVGDAMCCVPWSASVGIVCGTCGTNDTCSDSIGILRWLSKFQLDLFPDEPRPCCDVTSEFWRTKQSVTDGRLLLLLTFSINLECSCHVLGLFVSLASASISPGTEKVNEEFDPSQWRTSQILSAPQTATATT